MILKWYVMAMQAMGIYIRIKSGSIYSLNNPDVIPALRALFKLVKALGGTISGEHGIGLVQKEYMDIVFDPITIELMRGIKKHLIPIISLTPENI